MKNRKTQTQDKNLGASLVLYTLLALLGAWRVYRMLRVMLPGLPLYLYAALYLLLCAALPLGYFLPRSRVSKWFDIIGNYWLCFQLIFFFAALVEWLGACIAVGLLRLLTASQYALLSCALFGAAALLTVYGIVHARQVRLTQYTCRVRKPSFSGRRLRIVHLSDLHLGAINDLNAVKKIVTRINALEPDLVCMTGDTFTENIHDVYDTGEIAAAFRSIRSRSGVYACLGNHDSGSELPQMLDFFRESGICVLVDECVEAAGILLLGRADMTPGGDLSYRRRPIAACLRDADPDRVIVVMDHQPGDIERTRDAGADILLSGHTHGGQFFPVHRMVRRIFPHYFGCKQYGDLYAIVSSGTCTAVPPIRIGSHSELVEIEVVPY